MNALFRPAQRLMGNLTYPRKFFLIALVLQIPLLLLFSQYVVGVQNDYRFTAEERLGLEYYAPLLNLLVSVQEHAVWAEAASGAAAGAAEKAAEVEAEIGLVDAVNARLGEQYAVSTLWAQWKADWAALQASLAEMTADERGAAHQRLGEQLIELITRVGNNSNLILDPDIDTYYLMDTLIVRWPTLLNTVGRIMPITVAAAERATLEGARRSRVETLAGLVSFTLRGNRQGYNYAYEFNPDLQTRIGADVEAVLSENQAYLDEVYRLLVPPGEIRVTQGSIESALTAANGLLARNRAFAAQIVAELDRLLVARLDRLTTARNLVILLTAASLLGAAYLGVGFYLATRQTIYTLEQAADGMVRGQVPREIPLQSRDELAQVVAAFNRIANTLVEARDQALESSRLKDQFLANMSHELRTPLNAIIGYTGLMIMGVKGQVDDTARGQLERIRTSSKHLLGLINDILDIAKIEAGQLVIEHRPTDIRALAERWHSQLEVLAKDKALQFTIDIAPAMPEEILMDDERLSQIAINLVSNAIKFTETGRVQLEIMPAEKPNRFLLRVADTGVGIPHDALAYIFDEFRQVDGSTQRKQSGTGLGLAIVRRLCIALGGNIRVISTVGEGSTFTAELPMFVPPDANKAAANVPAAMPANIPAPAAPASALLSQTKEVHHVPQ